MNTSNPYIKKTKKKRTKMTNHQFMELKKSFMDDIFPTPQKRINLANKLKLPVKTIQIWFQNQRQRAKIIEDEFKTKVMREILKNYETLHLPQELIPLEIMSFISTMELDRKKYERSL